MGRERQGVRDGSRRCAGCGKAGAEIVDEASALALCANCSIRGHMTGTLERPTVPKVRTKRVGRRPTRPPPRRR